MTKHRYVVRAALAVTLLLIDTTTRSRAREPAPAVKSELQRMIDSAQPDTTVVIPKGVYAEPVDITKPLTLRGESRTDCIFEVTANKPAIFIDTKGKGNVRIETVTVKWQLATSDRSERPFAVGVKDSTAEVRNCCFEALGNFKRSPVAINALGFSEMLIDTCRFEGFEFTVCYGEGAKGTIRNSLVMGSGHQGISLYSGATATITGNVITGSEYHGVRSTGGTLHMKDNLVISNANRGIYLGNKSAAGTIKNNLIIGNATGIGGFAQSKVMIENNVIADSDYAGIGMRDSCSLSIRDNIFRGNERGVIVFKEGQRGGNALYRNTHWQNKVDAENMDKPADSITADPCFADPNSGDFSLNTGPALEHKQGLTNPQLFKKLWKRWQNRSNENEPFTAPTAAQQAASSVQHDVEDSWTAGVSSPDKWTRLLPDGSVVKLVAVLRPKDDMLDLWHPEGGPADVVLARWDKNNVAGRELAVVFERPRDVEGENPAPDGKLYSTYGWREIDPSQPLVASYGRGYGQWQEIAGLSEGLEVSHLGEPYTMAMVEDKTLGRQKQILVTMWYSVNPEIGIRLVAVDRRGRQYPMEAADSWLGSPSKGLRAQYHKFATGLSKAELSHFILQKRPMAWAKFTGFATEPKKPGLQIDGQNR